MPKVSADASDAVKDLKVLEEQLEVAIPEAVEEEGGEKAKENVKKIFRNKTSPPSSASGQAMRSLTVNKKGNRQIQLLGNAYLDLVETGTDPHTPDVSERLRIWADQEGWEVSEIVDHIERRGTRPHLFKEDAFDRVVKLLPKRVAAHVRRSVSIS